jgi:glucans biosynthesis protein
MSGINLWLQNSFAIFSKTRPVAAIMLTAGFFTMLSGQLYAQAPAAPAAAQPTEAPAGEEAAEAALPDPNTLFFEKVAAEARGLAAKAFVEPDTGVLKFLRDISRSQWNGITFQEARRLWRDLDLDFQVGFFHPGFIFDQPPAISVIEDGAERPIPFSQDYFTYSDTDLKAKAGAVKLGFAGFRLMYPLHDAERLDEVVSFLGATHFRGLARHSRYGLEARGLILNPAHPGGEEFPYFRHFWIVQPQPEDASVTVFALLDSPSLTGVYRFVITPGPSTVMEVKSRLFKRAEREFPESVGLAPLGSMYLYSEKEGPRGNNWRPEVHNSDFLLFSTADRQWFSRPLSNPERLEINSYELNSPKGFGLMQRDDNFDHYQDLSARYDLRPSLWVEPVGDWGPGRLELLEIPANQDINSNILAFWRPDENTGGQLDYEYKIFWMPAGVIPHQLGRATDTRQAAWEGNGRHFIIDFQGPMLTDIPAESGLASLVAVSAGIQVQEIILVQNPVTGGWRLEFKIKPPETGVVDNLMSARGERRSLHLEAVLKKGENFPDSLTETWVYDLPY